MKQEQNWRIERRIPLAIIITLVMQFAVIIAWATQLDARVSYLESLDSGQQDISIRIARVEERIEGMRGDVVEMKHKLDNIAQCLPRR